MSIKKWEGTKFATLIIVKNQICPFRHGGKSASSPFPSSLVPNAKSGAIFHLKMWVIWRITAAAATDRTTKSGPNLRPDIDDMCKF